MNRSIVRLLACAVLLSLPVFASAGPGAAVTSFRILPADVPKFLAAYDKWMASASGKTFNGRIVMATVMADGMDPASHVMTSAYKSMADYDTYQQAALKDPAREEFLATVVPIAQLLLTGRSELVRSWGDVNDTDTIWQTHLFDVTDQAAVVAAEDAWFATPMGKAFPGQVHLSAIIAGGDGAPSHVMQVGWANVAEMEAYGDKYADDPAWTKFLTAMQAASKYRGANLARTLKTWGPATLKSLTR